MRIIVCIILFSLFPAGSFFIPETRIPGKLKEWKWINFKPPSVFTPAALKKTSSMDTSQLKQSGWYADAIKNIQESEYEIKPVDNSNEFSSPNRQQNLRAYYSADKFILEPREKNNWKLQLTLKGVYSGKKKIYTPQKDAIAVTDKNKIQFNHNNEFTVEYVNSKEGVRQNFIIQKEAVSKPLHKESFGQTLNIKLQTNKGWFINKVHPKEIHFAKINGAKVERKLIYNNLKVWDANNRELEASFSVSKNEISININSVDAVYPITIDPISTTPSAILQSNQANANFGYSVASAGDVNGDGYSDVIVGVPLYLYPAPFEIGGAFIFHGSSTGITTTIQAQLKCDQTSQSDFGLAVSGAGDVNNDGYSDVVVGARNYTNGQSQEGAAFVFLGSAAGIITTLQAQLEIDQAVASMGQSVACAGDVNGDSYSDIIVGASLYDNVELNEGAAFIYHGSATGINTTIQTQLELNQSSAAMGISVASAGDVNGDGYSDVIVGAPQFSNPQGFEGAAFVFHGSATGITNTIQTQLESNQANAFMGRSVAAAGDVNGDGYSDVIVGADDYDNGQPDEGAAFVFHGSITGITTTIQTQLEVNQINAGLGRFVAPAGDVNGDGYSDVIVGAYQYDNGQSNEGAAFVYHGSVTGISTTIQTQLESNQIDAEFGTSVASAGDINGDGYSDVIVGAPNYDNVNSNAGAAYVYHGSPDGLSATFVNTPDDCNQAFAEFGCSVSSAGDVNADGFSDVIIGAFKYDDLVNIDEGKAFVYYGSAAGLSSTPNSTPDDADQPGAYFGWSVASAGDINGDGYSDVIIGAYQYDEGGNIDEGRAFVYRGSAAGLLASPDINPPDDADQPAAWFGFSVAGAGDVNGDGYGDVIIGAHNYNDDPNTQEGRAFVYHGSASGLSVTPNSTPDDADQPNALFGVSVAAAGDVNGDGYGDVIIGADLYDDGFTDEGRAFIYHGSAIGLSASPNTILDDANQISAYFGRSVAAAGDVNGDGFGDVIVGAFAYNDAPNALEGQVYVYHGSAIGLSTTPNSILDDANQANAFFGLCVASAGDVNGDGYSDVIVGAYLYDDTNLDEGVAFIYHGSPTGLSAIPDNIPDDANQADAFFGYYVSSAGDINGDGYSDVIIGANGFDDAPNNDEGRAFIYYGNNTGGLRNNLRLYNSDLVTPIQQSNMADPNLFGAGLFAKSFLGRQKGRLVWQTVKNGQPFTGSPITNSTLYTAQTAIDSIIDLTGKELKHQIAKQNPTKATYIRARAKYDKATAITGQVYGPWRYPEGFLRGRRDIGAVALPVKFISFTAVKQNNAALLKWITADEEPGVQFEVQHSMDGINFTTLISIIGRNQTRNEYAWLHANPAKGNNFYRIHAVENQKQAYTATRKLNFNENAGISFYPNPAVTDQPLNIKNAAISVYQPVKISLINSSGQLAWQKEIVAIADGSVTLNIPDIPSGAYLLLVQAGPWTDRKKIIVARR